MPAGRTAGRPEDAAAPTSLPAVLLARLAAEKPAKLLARSGFAVPELRRQLRRRLCVLVLEVVLGKGLLL
jgi:hypothetical protein